MIAVRLCNKRSSVDLKRKVLFRHFLYFSFFNTVILYSVMWLVDGQIRAKIQTMLQPHDWTMEHNQKEIEEMTL